MRFSNLQHFGATLVLLLVLFSEICSAQSGQVIPAPNPWCDPVTQVAMMNPDYTISCYPVPWMNEPPEPAGAPPTFGNPVVYCDGWGYWWWQWAQQIAYPPISADDFYLQFGCWP